jgi:hypothetical protein
MVLDRLANLSKEVAVNPRWPRYRLQEHEDDKDIMSIVETDFDRRVREQAARNTGAAILLAAALEYAERGWAVFPLVPGAKNPLTPHGFKDASTDPEQIRAWWTDWPDANIGLATGAVNDLSVVDEDNKDGRNGAETLAKLLGQAGVSLDRCAQQVTPTGGHHYVLAYHELARNSVDCYGEGLDGRNDGGYIVAAPSVIGGKPYEWIVEPTADAILPFPGWLLEAAAQAGKPKLGDVALDGPETDWDALERSGVPKGQRDDAAWRLICHLHYSGIDKAECYARLDAFGSRCSPPFTTATDRRIAGKIERAYRKPAPGEVIERSWPKGVPSFEQGQQQQTPNQTLEITNMSAVTAKPINWLWPGRVPRGELTLIVGDPGTGKTLVTEDMSVRLIDGRPWPTGEGAPRGPIVYLTVEDNLATSMKPRLEAMGSTGEGFYAVTGAKDSTRTLHLVSDLARIEALCRSVNAALLVISPVNAYLGGGTGERVDNYRETDVRGVLTPLVQCAQRLDLAVVAVMHLNKTMQTQLLYKIGGSIGFAAVPRAIYVVCRDKAVPERRYLTNIKMSDAAEPKTLPFRIVPVGYSARIDWEPEVDERAADLMREEPTKRGPKGNKVGDAASWLADFLKAGPRGHRDVLAAASEMGFTEVTLKRAKSAAKAVSERVVGDHGHVLGWEWRLEGAG